jgi:ElaA protein
MQTKWKLIKFQELSPEELYLILQLRNDVFVVEQNCVFQDADGVDPGCLHLMGLVGQQLAAYTRLVPPGAMYQQASIGRVVTARTFRGTGIGRELMEKSIELVYKSIGVQPIKIGAQLYLKKFYSSLGFQQVSNVYLEDGIEHIYMVKP